MGAIVGTIASLGSLGYSIYAGERAADTQEEQYNEQMDLYNQQMAGQMSPADYAKLFTSPGIAEDILGGLNVSQILRYLTAPRNQLQKTEKRLFEESEPLFREVQDLLTGPIRDPLLELLSTGFRTDIAPIVAGEQYRLANETAPGLAERFSGALQGSGFANSLAQAGEDLGMYLGEKQVELDEAASGRRVQGLNMAPGLFTAPLDLQTGYAQAMGAAGDRWLARHPGARQLGALPGLANIEMGQGYFIPGYPQAGGYGGAGNAGAAGAYGALGNSLLNSLPQLLSLFNSGNTPAPGAGPGGGLYDTTVNMPTGSYLFNTQYQQPTDSSAFSLNWG